MVDKSNINGFALRSEESGTTYADTLSEAIELADLDETIWKISFNAANGERVRLVRSISDDWCYEPIP